MNLFQKKYLEIPLLRSLNFYKNRVARKKICVIQFLIRRYIQIEFLTFNNQATRIVTLLNFLLNGFETKLSLSLTKLGVIRLPNITRPLVTVAFFLTQ